MSIASSYTFRGQETLLPRRHYLRDVFEWKFTQRLPFSTIRVPNPFLSQQEDSRWLDGVSQPLRLASQVRKSEPM